MYSHVFADAMETHFKDDSMLRGYRIYLGVLAASILLWWPMNHFSFFLQFGGRPATFSFAVFVALAGMVYFAFRNPHSQTKGATGAEGWMRYGGLGPFGFFTGSMLFMLFHTVFLAALSLPLILASLAVSGADLRTCADAGAIIVLFSLTMRICHRTLLAAFPGHGGLRFLIISVVLLFFLLFSVRWLPFLNPIISVQSTVAGAGSSSLISPEFGTQAFRARSIRSVGVSASVCSLLYAGALVRVHRRIRRGA